MSSAPIPITTAGRLPAHLLPRRGHKAAPPPSPTRGLPALPALRGRLSEVSGTNPAAVLTMAVRWVVESQRDGEIVAWIHREGSGLYPPDLHDAGVDLERLVVVCVPTATDIPRAADFLLRSGGLGLAVLDFQEARPRRLAWLNRLLGLATTHQSAVLCLTPTRSHHPSLSSLVSLRVDASLRRRHRGGFSLQAEVLKDKRGNPHRQSVEECRGPLGLR